MIKTILASACVAIAIGACSNDDPKSTTNAATGAGGQPASSEPAGMETTDDEQPKAAGSRSTGASGASAIGVANGGRGANAGAGGRPNSGDVSGDAEAGRGGNGGAAVGGKGGAGGKTGAAAGSGGAGGRAGAAGSAGAGGVAGSAGGAGTAGAAGGGGSAGGAAGSAGGAGTSGAAGGGGGAGGSAATFDVPEDPAEPGPWPVGVRTVTLDLGVGSTQVEVWYPAQVGSTEGKTKEFYDFADWLPPENGIDPNAPTAGVTCDCYRNLPIDAEHGPYPVSILVHGAASFRTASTSELAHWASRGFIAIAADHPGLDLRDRIAAPTLCTASGIPEDITHVRDIPALLRALRGNDGGFGFLAGAIDLQHIAVSGHAEGAAFAADASGQAGVQLIMAWDSNQAITKRGDVVASVYLSGLSDKVVAYDSVVNAWDNTQQALKPTLLAGIAKSGHLGVTDLCGARNSDGQDAVAIGIQYNVCGGGAFAAATQAVWDCTGAALANNETYIDQATATKLVSFVSTAALEEFLKGADRKKQWADFKSRTAEGELRESR